MKRRTFINPLLITAASMGVIKGIDIPKEPHKLLSEDSISFEKFFFMANGFHMNQYQELYYNAYISKRIRLNLLLEFGKRE